jgi:alpha-ketoglutarate-dependent 2,4-dichlorophenoxyacetate dioxygenase
MIVGQLHPRFGAEISDIDLRDGISDEDVAAIRAAVDRFGVLVFRGQHFADDEQLAFAQRFGPVTAGTSERRKRLKTPGLADLSNLNEDDEVMARDDARHLFSLANQLWHADLSFVPQVGCYSFLSCREAAAAGGETEYTDLREVYEALPEALKVEAEGAVTEHSFMHSRRILGFNAPVPEIEALPPMLRPLVYVHPESGRKSLYLASHASHIVGRPVPEGRLFLFRLMEFATQREFVYRHHWTNGDFIIWDNRCTMHRGLPYDPRQRRDIRRVTTRYTGTALDVSEREPALA